MTSRAARHGRCTVFGSPSNIWPQDRSWLVWSDWDLWATKVSGSDELIDRLKRDPLSKRSNWRAEDPTVSSLGAVSCS